MNQTRTLLLFAWLALAALVWQAWNEPERPPAPADTATVPTEQAPSGTAAGDAVPAPTAAAPAASPAATPEPPAAPQPMVELSNDMLRLGIDAGGGSVVRAELLAYGQTAEESSPRVRLLSDGPQDYYLAQSGLISADAPAPSHAARFELAYGPRRIAGDPGRTEIGFVWRDEAAGLQVRKIYTLTDGSYVLTVREEIENAGPDPWRGQAYRQLVRIAPEKKRGGFTNPETFSFVGAGWYSPGERFDKRAFTDFADGPLQMETAGGWVAMLQHYFLAAWIPAADEVTEYSLTTLHGAGPPQYLIRGVGPTLEAQPGGSAVTEARLWVGPKLQDVLSEVAPGLGLTINYGVFTALAVPLHWMLSHLHWLFGNWGWAIIALVVLIKGLLFKLSEMQYKSMARMRAFQPRIEALKERYGEDKQKFQQALMELYKKEKINPVGGCLPILVQIPVFIALYWVLLESVELRHAPWIGWIDNLTARDPYFVLPALNMLTMWLTQKLTPSPGMDPTQAKMMQMMPLVFGVMFAFFPAGLVLYWTTNGALGLAQQWVITRRHGEKAAKPAARTS